MTVELIKKTRAGRILRVTISATSFIIDYRGLSPWESVLVDGKLVAKEFAWLRMTPRFNFSLGTHQAVIRIETTLWRDLLGPVFGRVDTFSLELDGKAIYNDAY